MNDKMIEEMARDIRVALEFGTYENLPIHIKDRVLTGVRFNETAKILAKKYQPKIPENSVVLTEDEVYEFRKDQAEVKFLKNKIVDQARKETAKEILNEIWHSKLETTIPVSRKHNIEDIKIACQAVVGLLRDKIQEIAKKYGVEVEE